MRFSVVIATKGRPDVLLATLRSVTACDPPPEEVLVVDGDPERSAESVVDAVSGSGDSLSVRYLHSRPGLTIQRNCGIDEASGEVVVFLDDDVEVARNLFAVLDDAYGDQSVVGATGRILEAGERRFGNTRSAARRLLFRRGAEGSMTAFGYPRRIQDVDRERDVEFMQGCFMTARTEVAARLRFDEALAGYALAEDEDFSYRLSREGRIRYLPAAVVDHKNIGFRSLGSREFNRMVVRNRAYLFRKNFRRTLASRIQFAMLILLLMVHRAVNREWSGVAGLAQGSLEAWRARG